MVDRETLQNHFSGSGDMDEKVVKLECLRGFLRKFRSLEIREFTIIRFLKLWSGYEA